MIHVPGRELGDEGEEASANGDQPAVRRSSSRRGSRGGRNRRPRTAAVGAEDAATDAEADAVAPEPAQAPPPADEGSRNGSDELGVHADERVGPRLAECRRGAAAALRPARLQLEPLARHPGATRYTGALAGACPRFDAMDYAIIKLGNKQHRVRDGERLVVDRLPADEGTSFEPTVLLGDTPVTATVVAHERGPKIVIGKYRKRTGYKRHNGFRAATSRIEITLGSELGRGDPTEVTRRARPRHRPRARRSTSSPSRACPRGYEELTVAQISAGAKDWDRAEVEAALSYEQAHAARKGAVAALESALAKEDEA